MPGLPCQYLNFKIFILNFNLIAIMYSINGKLQNCKLNNYTIKKDLV